MNTINIAGIKNWFEQAVPAPTQANRSVQLGCHFEEVGEMLATLLGEAEEGSPFDEFNELAKAFKQAPTQDAVLFSEQFGALEGGINRVNLLDDLCDQIVTAIGVAHMFGMNISGALEEVSASNWSKFKDGKPIFDANGKIAKNPDSYFKPNLAKFV